MTINRINKCIWVSSSLSSTSTAQAKQMIIRATAVINTGMDSRLASRATTMLTALTRIINSKWAMEAIIKEVLLQANEMITNIIKRLRSSMLASLRPKCTTIKPFNLLLVNQIL